MNEENEKLAAELKAKWQRRGLLAIDAAMGAFMLGTLAAVNELATDWTMYMKMGLADGALRLLGKCLLLAMAGGGLKVLPTAPQTTPAPK